MESGDTSRRAIYRPPLEVSNLELVFDFRSRPFRDYMMLARTTKSTTPSELAYLSRQMTADSDHPLVTYAAGWAAAEAALFREERAALEGKCYYQYSEIRRFDALETAQSLWNSARPALGSWRTSATKLSHHKIAQIYGLEVRSRLALAHLPSMQLAAGMMVGLQLEEPHIEGVLQRTRHNVLDLSNLVTEKDSSAPEYLQIRSGLCGEILCGLLLQGVRPLQHIILPASLRQDHNRVPALRGDVIATSTAPPYRKTLVQITSFQDKAEESKKPFEGRRLIVDARQELMLYQTHSSYTTLKTLLSREGGSLPHQYMGKTLDQMAAHLMARLVELEAARG